MPARAALTRVTLALTTAVWAACTHAAPFVPANDAEIVERLPARIGSTERQMRAQLQADPAQLPLALQLARDAIGRARQNGDPRELGQAQAALAPWWHQADPPPAVRLLRATLRQSEHQFEPALADLSHLLDARSNAPLAVQAQAELTRATVLQVQGRWLEAAAGCERLAGPRYAALGDGVRVPAQACMIELASLQGPAPHADQALAALASGSADTAGWIMLMRAELAERAGSPHTERLYRQALAQQPDVYTQAAFADWLLSQRRHGEVVTLLAGRDDADALLLRLGIAWQRSGDKRAQKAIATLSARFAAAEARGDSTHGREQARFALDLLGDAKAALLHAERNWKAQKEPADALLLLRAAEAAGRPDAAAPVRQFIRGTGWTDARLSRMATARGAT